MYLGGSPYTLPGMFTILPYGEMAYGLWLPVGGVYGLIRGITKLAVELGVEIHTNRRVRRIATEHGRIKGLELADGSFQASSLVISNVDVPTTDTSLLAADARVTKKLRRSAERMRMTPGVITFYWGVSGEVGNLGHHTIFLPDDYRAAFRDLLRRGRIPHGLPFYVSIPSATDTALAPAGDSAVFVLVPVPVLSELPELDWDTAVRDVRARVLATLARHDIKLTEDRISFEEVYTPVEWRRRFGLYDGSAFGAAHNLSQLGALRRRNFSAEIAGLYYAGASTTPGTGMPMVVLGGRQVAERIVSHVR
jgi:phytoene desaturase